MSQHVSFGGSGSMKKHRTVLKRYEKIESLEKKDKWKRENGIYGLPKVKVVKIKAKKEKPKAEGAAAEGQPGAAAEGAAKPPA